MKKSIRLNLGCGVVLKPGFINVDKEFTVEDLKGKKGIFTHAEVPKNAEFVKADVRQLPFPDNYADYAIAMHVIEHIGINDTVNTLKEWFRVLKPGGELRITCPNFDDIARRWVQEVADNQDVTQEQYVNLAQGIYGIQITEGEHHRTPMTPKFFNWCLGSAGFKKWEMAIFPSGHKTVSFDGYKPGKGFVYRFGEIHIKAKKPWKTSKKKQQKKH
jgi:predicted SAM-dependent methyltransferase